ncbi:substrate-binding domain-containing protein [Arthrobacter sp. KNU40]|uniref:substrate-binding domain-containing protein n=1 Tax=Arthrobacter sp. KNU40 TaxID=3447965 RepID=UPI003F6295FC
MKPNRQAVRRGLRAMMSLAVVATVALTTAGCGGSVTGQSAGSPTAQAGAKAKVGYVDGNCQNSWRVTARAEWEAAAKNNPMVSSYQYVCAHGELNQEIAAIESMVSQGYNVLTVYSDFGKALLPAVRAAYKRGVQVVPWDSPIGGTAGQDYTAFVGPDLKAVGAAEGKYFADKLNGKGNIAFISGPAGNEYNSTVNAAAVDTLKQIAPGINVLETVWADWDPGKSAQAASALLSKYPKIDGVMIDEASAVQPVIARWQNAHRPLPLVYSNDLNGLMRLYDQLAPTDPTFGYGFHSSRTWAASNALEAGLKAYSGESVPGTVTVDIGSYDCATDCKNFYKADMPDDFIPTTKVPADVLKPLLTGR